MPLRAKRRRRRSSIINGTNHPPQNDRETMRTTTSLLALLALTAVSCNSAAPAPPSAATACPPVDVRGPDGQPLDLSGTYSGNDQSTYHIRQIDSCVWWSGQSGGEGETPGARYTMVFRGTLGADSRIRGEFVDVAGSNPGTGTMTLVVEATEGPNGVDIDLRSEEVTGHQIGVSFWERQQPATGASPDPDDSPGATDEDTTAEPTE